MQIMVIERRGRLHLIRGAQDRLEKMAFELSLRAWPAETSGWRELHEHRSSRRAGQKFQQSCQGEA